jgi:hypothetical protein
MLSPTTGLRAGPAPLTLVSLGRLTKTAGAAGDLASVAVCCIADLVQAASWRKSLALLGFGLWLASAPASHPCPLCH